MLLIVTVVCAGDLSLAERRVLWMTEMGQQPTHDLLLINDGSIGDLAFGKLVEAHKPLFRSVTPRKLIDRPLRAEWPYTVNHAWHSTCQMIGGMYGEKFDSSKYHSWLFFEPDVTPLVVNWAPILESRYVKGRKPFMGYVHSTKTSTGEMIEHMNGAGVYPVQRRFYLAPIFLAETVPWDVAGLSGANLAFTQRLSDEDYAMAFGSRDYHRTQDMIHFSSAFEVGNPYFCLKNQIVHHGCKDGSLMEVLSKFKGNVNEPVIIYSSRYSPPSSNRNYNDVGKDQKDYIKDLAKKDFLSGMVFKQVMRKHRLSIKQCAAIKKEAGV